MLSTGPKEVNMPASRLVSYPSVVRPITSVEISHIELRSMLMGDGVEHTAMRILSPSSVVPTVLVMQAMILLD